MIQPHLHTLKILLGILNLALQHEQLESSGLGATVAQQVLSVTEPILQEASSQQRVIVRSISEEVSLHYICLMEETYMYMCNCVYHKSFDVVGFIFLYIYLFSMIYNTHICIYG